MKTKNQWKRKLIPLTMPIGKSEGAILMPLSAKCCSGIWEIVICLKKLCRICLTSITKAMRDGYSPIAKLLLSVCWFVRESSLSVGTFNIWDNCKPGSGNT